VWPVLALDNLLGADVVLHDGRFVTATPSMSRPVLATRRRRKLRRGHRDAGPAASDLDGAGGRDHVSLAAGPRRFHAYNELAPTMPDELTVQIAWSPDRKGTRWCTWHRCGRLRRIRRLDPYIRWGRHHEMRTRTLRSFNTGAIDALVDAGDTRASAYSAIAIHHCHGAGDPCAHRRDGIRHSRAALRRRVLAAWEPGDDAMPHQAWAQQAYTDLAPHSSTADTRI